MRIDPGWHGIFLYSTGADAARRSTIDHYHCIKRNCAGSDGAVVDGLVRSRTAQPTTAASSRTLADSITTQGDFVFIQQFLCSGTWVKHGHFQRQVFQLKQDHCLKCWMMLSSLLVLKWFSQNSLAGFGMSFPPTKKHTPLQRKSYHKGYKGQTKKITPSTTNNQTTTNQPTKKHKKRRKKTSELLEIRRLDHFFNAVAGPTSSLPSLELLLAFASAAAEAVATASSTEEGNMPVELQR